LSPKPPLLSIIIVTNPIIIPFTAKKKKQRVRYKERNKPSDKSITEKKKKMSYQDPQHPVSAPPPQGNSQFFPSF
jgi:hypothetical protein